MAALNDVRQTITIETKLTGADEATAKLNAIVTAQDGVSVSSATLTKAQLSVGNQLERLVQRIDPVARATRDLQKAQDLVNRATQQGAQGDYSSVLTTLQARLDQARKANDNFSQSTGLAAHQVSNLRSQVFDVFTSLQGGASPFTVLSQQGPQIYEALAGSHGVSGGLKAAAVSASGLVASISPVVAVVSGVTSAVVAGAAAYARYASNQKEVALGIAGAGRASGTSVSQINRVADASSIPGVSAQSVRELSTEFARTGKIGTAMFGDLSRFTKEYATLTGADLAQAGQEVASAFASQSQGALKLNETIGGLSGKTFELVRALEASGDRLGAQKVMLAAFSDATRAAAENTGLFARAWDGLKAGASNAFDFIGKQVAVAVEGGSDLQERLETAQKQLQSAKTRQGMLPSALSGLGDFDVSRSQERVDELTKAMERQKKSTQEAVDAQKTLAGSKALDAILPGRADLLQLETFRSTLQQAFDTGKGTSGTEEGLKRINELLKAGGTEAYNLMVSAKNAFANATLLPFQQQLSTIRQKYDELLKTAPDSSKPGLNAARELELGTARVAAINNPVRDAKLSLNEQIASLKVQRDSFLQSADAAGAMAAKQDLINQYMRAGVQITPALTKAIDDYATSAGKVAAANDNLQRTQQNIVAGMDEVRSGTQGAITGIFSAARQGQDVGKALLSSLGKMADQGFDRLISKPLTESLFGFMGKGGGGALGDMTSKAFGNVGAITTPMATVTASVVNVNGAGVGGVGIGGSDGTKLPLGGTAPISAVQSFPLDSLSSKAVGAGLPSQQDVAAYIRKIGPANGIDPDTWLKVAKQESGLNVLAKNINSKEESYGVMQLNAKGGLGNTALDQGIDIRDPSKWKEQLDFSAGIIKKDGWRQWYGARDTGVGRWDGIGKGGADPLSQGSDALSKSADQAGKSVSDLSGKLGDMPAATDGFTSSLTQLGGKLESASFNTGSGGGGFSFGSLFGMGGGGSSIDASGASWSANGNIMTSRGPTVLNRFANGGIATSPQLSVFGEGRTPEAYVPLPDGRSIPVSMKMPAMAANSNAAAARMAPANVSMPAFQLTQQISANGDATVAKIAADASRQAVGAYHAHLETHLPSMLNTAQKRRA